MFFLFSKLLLFLTKPFTWILILLTLSIVFKKRKWAKKTLILSFVFLLFFSNSFIFLEFSRLWEVHGQNANALGKYDCGLVLTGMASYNNDLDRLELNQNGDRIWQAMDLYHRKKIKKILISGDSGQVSDRGLHEAKQLADILIRSGIPKEDVIVEGNSQNTYQNALESGKLIKKKFPEWKKILLITNSSHMRRSLACFEKQGIHCIPFSVGLRTGEKRHYFIEQFFIPSVSTIEEWENLTKEWIGYVMYKLMGYL